MTFFKKFNWEAKKRERTKTRGVFRQRRVIFQDVPALGLSTDPWAGTREKQTLQSRVSPWMMR